MKKLSILTRMMVETAETRVSTEPMKPGCVYDPIPVTTAAVRSGDKGGLLLEVASV